MTILSSAYFIAPASTDTNSTERSGPPEPPLRPTRPPRYWSRSEISGGARRSIRGARTTTSRPAGVFTGRRPRLIRIDYDHKGAFLLLMTLLSRHFTERAVAEFFDGTLSPPAAPGGRTPTAGPAGRHVRCQPGPARTGTSPSDMSESLRDLGRFPSGSPLRFHRGVPSNHPIKKG